MFSMIIGGFSLIAWRTLILLIIPSFEVYLIPAHGSPIAYAFLAWFLLGGYRAAIILAWDRHENYFGSPAYTLKTWIIIPFTLFVHAGRSWPTLRETLQHTTKK